MVPRGPLAGLAVTRRWRCNPMAHILNQARALRLSFSRIAPPLRLAKLTRCPLGAVHAS